MTIAEWISAANALLKADPNLSYQQVEQKLLADGHKRPPGITQKGSSKGRRFGTKSKRTPGQNIRRATQELTSTNQADEANKLLAKQRAELQGIAEFAGIPTPHREHLYSQDVSSLLQTGAPSDFIENVPSDLASAKTALEQRIRTKYNNRYVVGVGVNGLRVIPVEFFDELVSPDDLPGIDINEKQVKQFDRIVQSSTDLSLENGSIRLKRGQMTALAGAGILALGPLGTAASAAETTERIKIAQQTGNVLDQTQAVISGVSLSADVASYNPLAAVPGALLSTGADAINLIIDGGRAMIGGTATYNRKQLERKERLRGLPADHPERQGFAAGGGM